MGRLAFSAREGCVTALISSSILGAHILCIGKTPRVIVKGYGLRRDQIGRCGRRLLTCRGRTVHALKITCGMVPRGDDASYTRLIGRNKLAFVKVFTVDSPVHPSIPSTIGGYRSTNVHIGVMAKSAPKATARVTQRVKL